METVVKFCWVSAYVSVHGCTRTHTHTEAPDARKFQKVQKLHHNSIIILDKKMRDTPESNEQEAFSFRNFDSCASGWEFYFSGKIK